MSKIKKYTLAFEVDYDYTLIGICFHNSDYNLAWTINEKLNLRLSHAQDEFYVSNKKRSENGFTYYYLCDEENHLEYYLIKNKSGKEYLIPEKQQIDFFLFIKGNEIEDLEKFINQLREIPSILTTFTFNPTDFDSTKNIIFD